jgi:hypothetical protein
MAEIMKLSKEVLAIQDYQPKDLEQAAKAEAFVRLYAEKKEAADRANAEFETMKDEAARLTDEYTAAGTPVVVYGSETRKKVCREFARKEAREITEGNLLAGLCAYYAEDINDRSGKAWDAFKSVTRPVSMPREIDEAKLEQAMLGQNHKVPVEVLEDPEVSITIPATFKTMLRPFSAKDEKTAAAGKMTPLEVK